MWIRNTAGKVRVFTSVADPGSEFFNPDPGSEFFTSWSRIRIFYIPDPASRGQKGIGSRIRNTGIYLLCSLVF
jgi:hypothetical protein